MGLPSPLEPEWGNPRVGSVLMRRLIYIPFIGFATVAHLATPTFFSIATKNIDSVLIKIVKHPFNQQLLSGRLPNRIFHFYLEQDNFYLNIYKKLSIHIDNNIARNSSNPFSLTKSIEHETKNRFVSPNIPLTPASYHYTKFLLMIAETESVEVLAAAMLPCQWIYQYVYHDNVNQQISKNHPYYSWLHVYSEKKYQQTTTKMIDYVNESYAKSNLNQQQKMLSVFKKSTEYEYAFWNDAFTNNTSIR